MPCSKSCITDKKAPDISYGTQRRTWQGQVSTHLDATNLSHKLSNQSYSSFAIPKVLQALEDVSKITQQSIAELWEMGCKAWQPIMIVSGKNIRRTSITLSSCWTWFAQLIKVQWGVEECAGCPAHNCLAVPVVFRYPMAGARGWLKALLEAG